MVTRRTALKMAASGLVLPSLPACGTSASVAAYEDESRELWRHSPVTNAGMTAQQLDLVRYAVLAPSSHNTQCWQFLLGAADIAIVPDLSRRCPAVDPDDHHLFVSLGCATENLVQAARAHGFDGHVQIADVDGGAIRVALARAPAVRSTLFEAIPARQSTRSAYDGRPLARRELDLLAQAGMGAGVQLQLITDRPGMERVLEAVVEANTVQLHDDAFRRELTRWIRFNREEARRTGDGLFSGASGSPSVPRWLGRLMLDLVMQPGRDGDRYAEQIRSSAGLAVFSSDRDDTAHRVEVGRCFQRFALQATALDVRTAMINQPVEVPAVRAGFATMLGLGTRRPDLVVRFGHGRLLPRSLRRPVSAVLG